MPETYIHFANLATVKTNQEWGGCSTIDYGGHLWGVDYAVNHLDRVDVYAYRVGDELEAEMRTEFATWTEKEKADDH